jgi:hypothetical protein
MSQQALLVRVAQALARLGVPYMVTGSMASSYHGEPRSTHDIDVVVELKRSDIPRLLAEFPEPDFYAAEHAIREAVAQRTNFNIIDNTGGDKIDFWILKDTPFDRERFSRRKPGLVGTQSVEFATAEDTILRKLLWSREMGGSERQLEDVLRIIRVQGAALDLPYLRRWAAELDVVDLLEGLFKRSRSA